MSTIIAPVKRFLRNPVLRREMDSRMRSIFGALSISFWLLLLSGIFLIAYAANVAISNEFNNGAVVNVGRIGREIFEWVLSGMIALILFLVPAFTSGAIAGERERRTLLPLQVTLLSPLSIVAGKVSAAVAFTILLLVMSTPLLAISFLVGGVTILDVVKAMFMLVLTAVLVGSIGVAISAAVKRVVSSIVLTYGAVLLMCIGTFVGLGVWVLVEDVWGSGNGYPPREIVAMNPFVATADIFDAGQSGLGLGDTATPLGGLRSMLDEFERDGDWWFDANDPDAPDGTAVWRWYVVGAALMTYLSIGFGIRKIRAPAESER